MSSSFDIQRKAQPEKKIDIKLNLIPKEITNIETRNPEYIKYSFHNGSSSVISVNNTNYNSHSLYVWKGKIHNIPSIEYDGELIVETLVNGGNGKCFVCFLLKHSSAIKEPTTIDKLWTNKKDLTPPLLFDVKMENPRVLFYKDGINNIIVYLTPIKILTRLNTESPFPKCFLMKDFSPDYYILNNTTIVQSNNRDKMVKTVQDHDYTSQTESIKKPTIEGMSMIGLNSQGEIYDIEESANTGLTATHLTEKGLYLDCAPTSQSTKTLNSITIPLDKDGNVNLSNSLQFSAIMTALIIIVIALSVLLTIPSLYINFVIKMIDVTNPPDKATRLKTVNYFLFVFFFTFAMGLFIDGYSNGNVYEGYTGLISFLMLFVSMIILYMKRNNPGFYFPLVYNWDVLDIYVWLKEVYAFQKEHNNIWYFLGLIFFILFPLSVVAAVSSTNMIPSHDNLERVIGVILGFGFPYAFFTSMYLSFYFTTVVNNTTFKKM